MVLVLGLTLVSLLVVTTVMAASAVYLGHKRLLSAADAAALAAADTFALGGVRSGGDPVAVLDDAAVNGAVARYLERTSAATRFEQLGVDQATGTPDRRTAHVVLTAVVRPPVVSVLLPQGVPITAVADARSQLRR